MLLSMLKRWTRTKPPPTPAQSLAPNPLGLPPAVCMGQAISVMESTSAPTSAEAALNLIGNGVLPILQSCVERGDIQTALMLEEWAYVNCIVRFENQAHYQSCFGLLEAPMHQLGVMRRNAVQEQAAAFNPHAPIAFYVHNLATDMAHVQLLADLIESYLERAPEKSRGLLIVGGSAGRLSARLCGVRDRYGVALERIDNTAGPAMVYESLNQWIRQNKVGQMVFVSLPPGLSYCSARIGSVTSWMSMKFELSNFPAVVRRYAFTSASRQGRALQGRIWRCAPPLFAQPPMLDKSIAPPAAVAQAVQSFGTILYSINRAEKISDAGFLDVVCELLARFADACFVWTGKEKTRAIVSHFERRGLVDRQFFAGWIEPDSLLSVGHIFLDTPHLSGTVAARAMCSGIPVISWTAAHSWLNFFMPRVSADCASGRQPGLATALQALGEDGICLECATARDYFETACKLISDPSLRSRTGTALAMLGSTYFLNRHQAASDHFLNMREPD